MIWFDEPRFVCLVNLEARRMRRSTDMAQSKVIMHARRNWGRNCSATNLKNTPKPGNKKKHITEPSGKLRYLEWTMEKSPCLKGNPLASFGGLFGQGMLQSVFADLANMTVTKTCWNATIKDNNDEVWQILSYPLPPLRLQFHQFVSICHFTRSIPVPWEPTTFIFRGSKL